MEMVFGFVKSLIEKIWFYVSMIPNINKEDIFLWDLLV